MFLNLIDLCYIVHAGTRGAPGRPLLSICAPTELPQDNSRMVLQRFFDERSGYRPKVHEVPGGQAAWVWNCFENTLHYVREADDQVTCQIPTPDPAYKSLAQIRLKDTRALCRFVLYHFDDYRSYELITVRLGSDATLIETGYEDGPDLGGVEFEEAFQRGPIGGRQG